MKLKDAVISEALSDKEKKYAHMLADKVARGRIDLEYIEKNWGATVNKDILKLIQKKVKAHRKGSDAEFIKQFVTHKGNPVFLD